MDEKHEESCGAGDLIKPLEDRWGNESLLSEGLRSPLWMLAPGSKLEKFVGGLKEVRSQVVEGGENGLIRLRYSRRELREIRLEFTSMIRTGEERLHKLCELLCRSLLDSFDQQKFKLQSVALGEVSTTHERFSLVTELTPSELYSITDIDLGNRQLSRLRWFDGHNWSSAALVSNVVEYLPSAANEYNLHKLLSRVKAEEEIWNKVVDELFDIDNLVKRDKQLRHLGRYVKDVFGIKAVVGSNHDAIRLSSRLKTLSWTDEELQIIGLIPNATNRDMQVIEVKDYLGVQGAKSSGWEAIKSVVRWGECMFEIQVQPLFNYLSEREQLTRESHAGFKSRREDLREQISAKTPLFRFYGNLLKWLFSADKSWEEAESEIEAAQSAPPQHDRISIELVD